MPSGMNLRVHRYLTAFVHLFCRRDLCVEFVSQLVMVVQR